MKHLLLPQTKEQATEFLRLAEIEAARFGVAATDRARLMAALQDAKRLDWLADPANTIGNVQLPTEAVTANLHSLRDAIDAAMAMPANTPRNNFVNCSA